MADSDNLPVRPRNVELSDILDEGEAVQRAIIAQLNNHLHVLATATLPSEIHESFIRIEKEAISLRNYFQDLLVRIEEESKERIINKEEEIAPQIDALRSKKSPLNRQLEEKDNNSTSVVLQHGAAVLVDMATTGGIFTAISVITGVMRGAANSSAKDEIKSQIDSIDSDISDLRGAITKIKNEKDKSIEKAKKLSEIISITPKIVAYRKNHHETINAELARYASNHHVDLDDIATYLGINAPKIALAFAAILKADYRISDLAALSEYAHDAPITASPEKRAVIQFINHVMIAHQDFFEIWASKMQDLESAGEQILQVLREENLSALPKLELFGEVPVTLSGRLVNRTRPIPSKDDATKFSGELVKITSNISVVYHMHALLADKSRPLKERHKEVKRLAEQPLLEFNQFFGRIDESLKEINNQLDRLMPVRDRAEMKWDRAESNATQRKLMEEFGPERRRNHNSKVNFVAGLVGLVLDGDPRETLSRYVGNEIRNYGNFIIADAEHAIRMASIDKRVRHTDEEIEKLKFQLDAFDQQIKNLIENKELMSFLSNNFAVESVRAIFMILPRLMAGEVNIDAIEPLLKDSGYKSIDNLITDIHTPNPRLAEALENSLFGFADTNDLKVLLAEANAISNPRNQSEKVLVGYVEKVIKTHYRDQARQASIVDYMEMRNVTITSRPFYSFGEVVKRETDDALKALLSGNGDFSLIGSNDVHSIFGYYQERHGKTHFVDIYDPKDRARMVHKRVHVSDPNEIIAKKEEVSDSRNAESRIPRLNTVFTEMCGYEYLLTQGINIVKDRKLASSPNVLGAFEMVNNITQSFINRLSLETARAHKRAKEPSKPVDLGQPIEGLIAITFVEFFSQMGALHSSDQEVLDKTQKVRNAYTGENFLLATESYKDLITRKAEDGFELFLEIYRKNLELYLESATQENRKLLLSQLEDVKDIMKDIQPDQGIVMPDSEEARLKAHYRNNLLSNLGTNPTTWAARAETIHKGGKSIN